MHNSIPKLFCTFDYKLKFRAIVVVNGRMFCSDNDLRILEQFIP